MPHIRIDVAVVSLLLSAVTACTNANSTTAPTDLLEVQVVDARQKDVPLYGEWIGTLEGNVNADIKAQVSGYLIQQAYTEGTFVTKGQLLFQIDPRPFQAALDQTKAQLAQAQGQLEQARAQLSQAEAGVAIAEANQKRTQLDVDRYTPLAQQQAITQQDLDNATQNNTAAVAQVQASRAQVETSRAQITTATAAVESARAAVATAQINLDFTRLTSPIDGIPGIAQLQVGALVSPASGPITTVSTLDPIRVYFTVTEQEHLEFIRRYPTEEKLEAAHSGLDFDLILADGSVYDRKGRFYFIDRQVDVRTGAFRVACLFPNPGNSLRPGQYARVRSPLRVAQGAILVPQRAVAELQGIRQVAVVGSDNKVDVRTVTTGDTVGNQWIISSGVKGGERVVAEGIQKVRQGMLVRPVAYKEK
jgi:RND family efflux transporter MFP subunit